MIIRPCLYPVSLHHQELIHKGGLLENVKMKIEQLLCNYTSWFHSNFAKMIIRLCLYLVSLHHQELIHKGGLLENEKMKIVWATAL